MRCSDRQGSFLDGGEQAIPVPAGLGQIGVQFEEFGTRLNFLPIVMGNGKIHLEVEPEVSSLSAQGETTLTPGGSPVPVCIQCSPPSKLFHTEFSVPA